MSTVRHKTNTLYLGKLRLWTVLTKHPSDVELEGVKAFPSMTERLMKDLQHPDNLFLVGLSFNHVDSISLHPDSEWLCFKLYRPHIRG